MEVNIVLLILGAFVVAALIGFFSAKASSASKKLTEAETSRQSLETKLAALRAEIASLKEENQRKSRSLEEARENAKKRLRKDAQKIESEANSGEPAFSADSENLKRNLAAMENQIRIMKKAEEEKVAQAKHELEESFKKEVFDLKQKNAALESKLEEAKLDASKKRSGVSKQLPNPIDLNEVPFEVVSELSRLLRKNEQHEKMHGIVQGKYQLAQERYQELQRRYFAVCRELALVALPQEETSDEEARKLAEKVVENSDKIAKEAETQEKLPLESAN